MCDVIMYLFKYMAKRTNPKGWEVSGFDEGSHTSSDREGAESLPHFHRTDYSAQLTGRHLSLSTLTSHV